MRSRPRIASRRPSALCCEAAWRPWTPRPLESLGDHPAVDDEFRAGHPFGLVRGQLGAPHGDVIGPSKPAKWRRRQTRPRELRIGMDGFGHRCVDEARVDGVYANPIARILHRRAFRQRAHGAFRGMIGGAVNRPYDAINGRIGYPLRSRSGKMLGWPRILPIPLAGSITLARSWNSTTGSLLRPPVRIFFGVSVGLPGFGVRPAGEPRRG